MAVLHLTFHRAFCRFCVQINRSPLHPRLPACLPAYPFNPPPSPTAASSRARRCRAIYYIFSTLVRGITKGEICRQIANRNGKRNRRGARARATKHSGRVEKRPEPCVAEQRLTLSGTSINGHCHFAWWPGYSLCSVSIPPAPRNGSTSLCLSTRQWRKY